MPIPFELVIGGPPVSQQARRRQLVREWTQEVESAAKRQWDSEPPFTGEVMVTITYFFDRVPVDVDNIPKPILDALKGLVYANDSQVSDLLCRRRYLHGDLRLTSPSPVLLATLRRSEQFLHIAVADALSQEVTFW